ncbi:SigB/SigF/SigG family RNA polymerase sigma factor [Pseudonocardia petroleophila]|uniref:SigB/SigF/SigG family RNA polymerase sigma factor n=1 Tax=Pseudonocardia petroleophila TaxID=37331 RepID=A0A7G7MT24_9PSEU|nr:SigB/SigF/SigG family RNA polymerase sigma factor [Pseudonocardia petroleophila]QNG55935.1 SigB/SigF/SigG family RNA polymerase sigma factor [Pseudonocardia petroleophila]
MKRPSSPAVVTRKPSALVQRSSPPAILVVTEQVDETSPAGALSATATRPYPNEYQHLRPKLAEFAAMPAGDPRRRALRDELTSGYWPVVVHIARRYRDSGEPLADLQQIGAIGLLGALDRFDPERGIDFLGYAVPTITGEIKRHFRDRTWSMHVPRRLKDLQVPIRDAVATLSSTLRRAPRPSEIAAHLGTTVEEVVDALGARQAHHPDSLDAIVGHNGTDTVLADIVGMVDTALDAAAYRHELRKALDDLPERERTIVVLRFFGELSQTQISAQVGVTQMHVSRLLSRTLATLRERIGTT